MLIKLFESSKRTILLNAAYTWNDSKEKRKAAYMMGLKTSALGE